MVTTTTITRTDGYISFHARNPVYNNSPQPASQLQGPLKPTNALDAFPHADVTPAIGVEFSRDIRLKDILDDEGNSDATLRELAGLISRRGVVIFRDQADLTQQYLNKLALKLGELSGKPASSKLHIHPLSKDFSETGEFIGEKISSVPDDEGRQVSFEDERSTFASQGWHTDIPFEEVPAAYSLLQIRKLPECGGDTMFSSMYSAYDKLSPAMKKFVEGLTAVHDAECFRSQSRKHGFSLYTKERGSPANFGDKFQAVHPVVRVNPRTGWKCLFVNKCFTVRINELSKDESDNLLNYLFRMIAESFDFQCRLRWGKDDLAIWDNASTQHSGTFDFTDLRYGDRTVVIGEKPYYHVEGLSRKEALQAKV